MSTEIKKARSELRNAKRAHANAITNLDRAKKQLDFSTARLQVARVGLEQLGVEMPRVITPGHNRDACNDRRCKVCHPFTAALVQE